jgi:SAM-dependent methyltransferase
LAHKNLFPGNLYKDLGYLMNGNYVTDFLFKIHPPVADELILELGSGSGKLGLAYGLEGCDVTLIDVDGNALEYSDRLLNAFVALNGNDWETLQVNMTKGSLFEMVYDEGLFHFVFNEGVVQHWPDEETRLKAIQEMVRVCAPGGTVCVIGNNGNLKSEIEADMKMKFTYEGMPETRRCFRVEELAAKLLKVGLEGVHVGGVGGGELDSCALIAGWGKKPYPKDYPKEENHG